MENAKERIFKITESEVFKMKSNKENQKVKVNEDDKHMDLRRIQRLLSYASRIQQLQETSTSSDT